VAAGSESSGFWFELQFEVSPPTRFLPSSQGMVPRFLPLQLFVDNVAHSNRKHGLRKCRLFHNVVYLYSSRREFCSYIREHLLYYLAGTYPTGWQPPTQAIFDNTRSYKNTKAGVFFHNSQDLKLQDGALADNSVQADFDKADNVEIFGTEVTGTTTRYGAIVSTQNLEHDNIIGLQLHGYAMSMSNQGATIRKVRFSGFPDGSLIDVDDNVRSGHFDYW